MRVNRKQTLKYSKKRIPIGVVWFLVLLFILPMIESKFYEFITNISSIIYLASFGIGFYNAYTLTKWIDRKISETDFGIWSRRVIAGSMTLGGFALAILFTMSTIISGVLLESKGIKTTSLIAIDALILGFSAGLVIFASYMEFTHERKAGVIIHHGRTKY